MKKFYILLFWVLASITGKAQDTIVLGNWHEMAAKELKAGAVETEFKTTIFKKERVVVIPNKKIFATKYSNGSIVDAKGYSMSAIEFEYRKLTDINRKKLKRGIATTVVTGTVVAGGLGIIGTGAFLFNRNEGMDNTLGGMCLVLGSVVTAAAIPFTTIGAIQIRKAKKGLRKAEELKASMSFNPLLAPSINTGSYTMSLRMGMGVRINF